MYDRGRDARGGRLLGLPPAGSAEPRILVLGSFPSARSLELGRYYGHGRNHFWAIMGTLCGFDPALPYEERLAALAGAGIALWDVIASCEREGSLDRDIRAEEPNAILDYLAGRPRVERLGLNGGKAASALARLVAAGLGPRPPAIGEPLDWRPAGLAGRSVAVTRLPSTSPVPTRDYRRAEDKLDAWAAFLDATTR